MVCAPALALAARARGELERMVAVQSWGARRSQLSLAPLGHAGQVLQCLAGSSLALSLCIGSWHLLALPHLGPGPPGLLDKDRLPFIPKGSSLPASPSAVTPFSLKGPSEPRLP